MSLTQFPPTRSKEENADDVRIIQEQPDTPEAREALERVVNAYRGFLFSACMLRVGDMNRAEEVAQRVALRIFKKIHQLRDPLALTGWIRRLINTVSMHFMTQEHRASNLDEDLLEQTASYEVDQTYELLQQERSAALHEALSQLKDLDRETLEAFYLRGRSLLQMSEEFNTPVGTIKRRLHVARRRLKEVLSDNVLFADEVAQSGEMVHAV